MGAKGGMPRPPTNKALIRPLDSHEWTYLYYISMSLWTIFSLTIWKRYLSILHPSILCSVDPFTHTAQPPFQAFQTILPKKFAAWYYWIMGRFKWEKWRVEMIQLIILGGFVMCFLKLNICIIAHHIFTCNMWFYTSYPLHYWVVDSHKVCFLDHVAKFVLNFGQARFHHWLIILHVMRSCEPQLCVLKGPNLHGSFFGIRRKCWNGPAMLTIDQ